MTSLVTWEDSPMRHSTFRGSRFGGYKTVPLFPVSEIGFDRVNIRKMGMPSIASSDGHQLYEPSGIAQGFIWLETPAMPDLFLTSFKSSLMSSSCSITLGNRCLLRSPASYKAQ